LFPYLLVAPAVLYLMMITLYPGVYAVWQSFFQVRFTEWIPVGFDNYIELLRDREFGAALWNTFVIGAIALSVETALALLLAFHAYRDPWVKGWRILFLPPVLFMLSAVAFLLKLAFNDARVVSDVLMRLGLARRNLDFLGDVWAARLTLIVADVW